LAAPVGPSAVSAGDAVKAPRKQRKRSGGTP
jgi:hypothetical protein